MQQEDMDLVSFQKKFADDDACYKHLFRMRWPEGYRCPRCGHNESFFHRARRLYQCKACKYQTSLTAGTVFHKTRTPLVKWFWMIFLMGRQKSGASMLGLQRMLAIKSYETAWSMGHKIRKAMQQRDAPYQLAGLIEMDDSYFGASKPGKRGRGAEGKTKVVVAVQSQGDKPGFAKMEVVPRLNRVAIGKMAEKSLRPGATVRTDGLKIYSVLGSKQITHNPIVVGSGKNASKILRWVHMLIANVKGNIRGVHHGVGSKHLHRYLAEHCYRFNRRFWEPQMFDRILVACLAATPVSYAELAG
jgi:transposase-like protein